MRSAEDVHVAACATAILAGDCYPDIRVVSVITKAVVRFFGVWNGCRSRPAAKWRNSACNSEKFIPASPWRVVATPLESTGPCHRQPQPTTASHNDLVTQPDDTLLLFDFSDPAIVRDWSPIDDRIMGGISRSRLRHDPAGHAVFEGTVSLERNGGFASVRSSSAARGLPGGAACVIEIRGDNKQFKLSLLTDDGFDSLNYQASFTPSGTDWQTLHLPLATFRASFRGREVPGATALDLAHIRQVGLMIAARQAGPFELDIRRISLA
jgi:hypothetical protein